MARSVAMPSVFLNQTISTKRSPSAAGGKVSAAVANLSSVAATELMPVDADLREQVPELATYARTWQLFVGNGVDIQEGDRVVIGSAEYPVRYVEVWPWPDDTTFTRVVVAEAIS